MYNHICLFVSQLALEKEELRIHLQASKEAQRQLTAEVEVHILYILCDVMNLKLKQLCVCKSGLRLSILIINSPVLLKYS